MVTSKGLEGRGGAGYFQNRIAQEAEAIAKVTC